MISKYHRLTDKYTQPAPHVGPTLSTFSFPTIVPAWHSYFGIIFRLPESCATPLKQMMILLLFRRSYCTTDRTFLESKHPSLSQYEAVSKSTIGSLRRKPSTKLAVTAGKPNPNQTKSNKTRITIILEMDGIHLSKAVEVVRDEPKH